MDNSIKELALYAAKRKVPTEFAQRTVEDVNDALRNELKQFSDFNYYRKNKYDLFCISLNLHYLCAQNRDR